MLGSELGSFIPFPLIALVIGLIPIALWTWSRWRKLKPELFPKQEQTELDVEMTSARMKSAGAERVLVWLSRARAVLEEERLAEAKIAVNALKKLEAAGSDGSAAIYELMVGALDSADISSLLLGFGGVYVYVVVVPNRHEHAHLLRRYAPFASGWRHHAEGVRASLQASSDFVGMTALLFFLSPEGGEATMLMSCVDAEYMLMPATLQQDDDPEAPGVTTYGTTFDFNLAT